MPLLTKMKTMWIVHEREWEWQRKKMFQLNFYSGFNECVCVCVSIEFHLFNSKTMMWTINAKKEIEITVTIFRLFDILGMFDASSVWQLIEKSKSKSKEKNRLSPSHKSHTMYTMYTSSFLFEIQTLNLNGVIDIAPSHPETVCVCVFSRVNLFVYMLCAARCVVLYTENEMPKQMKNIWNSIYS